VATRSCFVKGSFRRGSPNEIADLAEPAAIPETAIASRAGDLRARVDGADISVSLDSGFAHWVARVGPYSLFSRNPVRR